MRLRVKLFQGKLDFHTVTEIFGDFVLWSEKISQDPKIEIMEIRQFNFGAIDASETYLAIAAFFLEDHPENG